MRIVICMLICLSLLLLPGCYGAKTETTTAPESEIPTTSASTSVETTPTVVTTEVTETQDLSGTLSFHSVSYPEIDIADAMLYTENEILKIIVTDSETLRKLYSEKVEPAISESYLDPVYNYPDIVGNFAAYDDAFFESHILVLYFHQHPQTGYSHSVQEVIRKKNGEVLIHLVCELPYFGGDALDEWLSVVELEKDGYSFDSVDIVHTVITGEKRISTLI